MKKPAYLTANNKIRWHASICFDKTGQIGRLKLHALMKAGDGFMGRLGGGWAWKLGILAARNEIVLELFVMNIRFTLLPKLSQRVLEKR